MFWKFNLMTTSHIDTLLDKEVITKCCVFAIVTNLGHCTASILSKMHMILQRLAGGQNNRMIQSHFCWHMVKLRSHLKFYCTQTLFCWVIEVKMTSAGHHMASGRSFHTMATVWKPYNVWKYGAQLSIIWCLTRSGSWRSFRKAVDK